MNAQITVGCFVSMGLNKQQLLKCRCSKMITHKCTLLTSSHQTWSLFPSLRCLQTLFHYPLASHFRVFQEYSTPRNNHRSVGLEQMYKAKIQIYPGLYKYRYVSRMWWHNQKIPGPKEAVQEDYQEFEASLIYIVGFRSSWAPE